MAHLVETMFSVKERPWHGIGTIIMQAPTIEEGIKLAGLDWNVSLQNVQVEQQTIQGYKAVLREDNNKCLGIVSDKYKILQNKDAFEFFQPFLDNEYATLETAGCLDEGKRIWVLAKLNSEDMIIGKDDRVEKYLLLSNAHNGSAAIKVGYCAIRVVCNNTLTAAESSVDSQLIRITHRGDIAESLDMVRDTMSTIDASFKTTETMYKALAQKTNINKADIEKYIKAIYSRQAMKKNFEDNVAITDQEVNEARKKLIARVEELFELEPVHNAWTLYNSYNYILNHEKGKTAQATYNSLWFGTGKQSYRQLDKAALQEAILL